MEYDNNLNNGYSAFAKHPLFCFPLFMTDTSKVIFSFYPLISIR